ncbi:MAG: polyprenyl synthetase family protein [Chloroflexales bacterium]|nr:polyprenyl synthetase family protein [Chloroflexales bacterium]
MDLLLGSTSTAAPEPRWLEVIARIAETLSAEPSSIAPFVEAWRQLYVVTLFLDHVQDDDPLDDPQLEALPPPLQYHLAFSVYIAAQHALAHLDPRAIPAARITRLQRFWTASVAQIASGQYLDLTTTSAAIEATDQSPLDRYEQLALQKTGATFALAFGGAALLATDDEAQIAALTSAGSIYGMLLQYHDDLLDQELQESQPEALTLTRALLAAHPSLAAYGPHAALGFWHSIYAAYTQALTSVLEPLPAATRTIYRELLRQSFGDVPASVDAPYPVASRDVW